MSSDSQLFIADPIEDYDPSHDTTYDLMREAQQYDRKIYIASSSSLFMTSGEMFVKARRVSIQDQDPPAHFQEIDQSELSLDVFECVWMREDPPFDERYLYSTYLLEHCPVPVFNDPRGIRNSNEKMTILEFPELIPETWVGADFESAWVFIQAKGGEAVLKTLTGYGGEEVHRLRGDRENQKRIFDDVSNGQTEIVMVQEFLPEVLDSGDRRIIVLGGDPVGGLTRIPSEGDFRANLHSGGSASDVYLTDDERMICERLKPTLLNRGLHLVGIDVVQGNLLEVNVTSPTCVQEITRGSDRNVGKEIIEYALQQCGKSISS
ncbi:MAG: glutathione synthase [bacterium]